MALNGIDISNYQRGLDLAQVPCDFVICKATEGTTIVHNTCDPWIQQAIKLGKLWGFYHFMNGEDPIAQAKHFVASCRNYFGNGIPVLDYEMYGRIGTDKAKQFLDYVYDQTGVRCADAQRRSGRPLQRGSGNRQPEGGRWRCARLHRQERRHAQRDWRFARYRLAHHRKQERHWGTLYDLPRPEAFLLVFKRGTLTRGAPLSGVRRAYSKPPIWCFANTGNCYFWHVPTTTNQFFDTLTMQVSSWIAARLAVLVEFAVFLISSTKTHHRRALRV